MAGSFTAAIRCICLAVIGASLAGATATTSAPQKSDSAQNVFARTVAIPNRSDLDPKPKQPCGQRRYKSDDDLCAQWKAADAAADAASWSWWQLWIGFVGLILGSVTMGAAIAAALYAKRAAVATEQTVEIARAAANDAVDALAVAGRNADAAVKLADQAEKTSERQLRAYVHLESLIFHHGFADSRNINIVMAIANHGQTPARITRLSAAAKWKEDDGTEKVLMDHDFALDVTSFKDLPVRIPLEINEPPNRKSRGLLVVNGHIFYLDVFNVQRQTGFVFTSSQTSFFNLEDGHRLSYQADEMNSKVVG